MTQLSEFFFIYQSISDVTLVIFGLTATFYLWQIKHKSVSSWLMFGFFASLTIAFTALFLRVTEHLTDPIIVIGIVAALGFLAQFAYHVPTNNQPQEAKTVLLISTSFLVGEIILAGYYNYLIFSDYPLKNAGQILDLAFFLVLPNLSIVFTVFIRRLLYLTPASKQSWLSKLRLAVLNPPNHETRTLRNIMAVILVSFIPNLADTLTRFGLITVQLASYTITSGLLLTLFCLFLIYVNHAPEQVSFIIKLVAVSLFTLLTIFNGAAIITTSSVNLRFEVERQANLVQVYYAIQHNDEIGFIPNSVDYILRSSSSRSQPSEYEPLLTRTTEVDLERFALEDRQRQTTPNLFVPTVLASASSQFEQSTHTPLVSFRRAINPLDFYQANYIAYRFQQNNWLYEVGFPSKPYQQAIHELAIQLMALVIGSSLIIIFIFPLFFQMILVTPLNNLLEGIKQANEEYQPTPIPVQYDDEIGFLTHTFNKLLAEKQATIKQLKTADRAKSQFITMMSHELRTPLNAINGFSELLVLGMSGELPKTARNDVQLIYQNGQHLMTLIEDILDMIQIEMNEVALNLETVNVEEVVQKVSAEIRPILDKKSLDFDHTIADGVEFVQADPFRLKQILFNIMQNAVKFTTEGQITLHINLQDEDTICFSVNDTGVGIPKSEQARLFESFQQLDMSDAREHGGTGLGLSICRELVQLHQGDIWLESEEGEGTMVHFTMPIAH